MKKAVLYPIVALVIAGGALLGGAAVTDHIWQSAYADGVQSVDAGPEAADPALPDVEGDPVGAAKAVWELWKGARVPAIILGVFLLAALAYKRKWLKGKWAIYLGTAVGAGLVIAERAANGDTPSVALVAQFAVTVVLAVLRLELGDKTEEKA